MRLEQFTRYWEADSIWINPKQVVSVRAPQSDQVAIHVIGRETPIAVYGTIEEVTDRLAGL